MVANSAITQQDISPGLHGRAGAIQNRQDTIAQSSALSKIGGGRKRKQSERKRNKTMNKKRKTTNKRKKMINSKKRRSHKRFRGGFVAPIVTTPYPTAGGDQSTANTSNKLAMAQAAGAENSKFDNAGKGK